MNLAEGSGRATDPDHAHVVSSVDSSVDDPGSTGDGDSRAVRVRTNEVPTMLLGPRETATRARLSTEAGSW
jgi:hypothetical protein